MIYWGLRKLIRPVKRLVKRTVEFSKTSPTVRFYRSFNRPYLFSESLWTVQHNDMVCYPTLCIQVSVNLLAGQQLSMSFSGPLAAVLAGLRRCSCLFSAGLFTLLVSLFQASYWALNRRRGDVHKPDRKTEILGPVVKENPFRNGPKNSPFCKWWVRLNGLF